MCDVLTDKDAKSGGTVFTSTAHSLLWYASTIVSSDANCFLVGRGTNHMNTIHSSAIKNWKGTDIQRNEKYNASRDI